MAYLSGHEPMHARHDRTWTTASLQPSETFPYWREAVHEAFLPLTMERRGEGRFEGCLTSHALDAVSVNRVVCGRHSVDRTRANIARSADEYFYLLCPLASRVVVGQYRRQAELTPGDCALAASDDPFLFDFRDDIHTISVQIPLAMHCRRHRLHRRAFRRSLAVAGPGRESLGRVRAPAPHGA
jgi:hypothetical protein